MCGGDGWKRVFGARGAGLLFGKFPHQVWFGKWKWNPSPLTYGLLKYPWAVHLSISIVELHDDRERKAGQVYLYCTN